MSKTTNIIVAALVITVVAIAIGYANISEQIITISGQLEAVAAQANFKLYFEGDGVITEGSAGTVTTTKTSDTSATFSVEGLTTVGDTASATYTIKNASLDLVAENLAAAVTAGNTKYFETTVTQPKNTTLNPNGTTTITVTTKLIKAPVSTIEQNVTVEISATPAEV